MVIYTMPIVAGYVVWSIQVADLVWIHLLPAVTALKKATKSAGSGEIHFIQNC